MQNVSSGLVIAIIAVTVYDCEGRQLHRTSIAIPEEGFKDVVDQLTTTRAAAAPGSIHRDANYCDIVVSSAAGEPWMTKRLDFSGVDWLVTIQQWTQLADAERIIRALALELQAKNSGKMNTKRTKAS